MKNGKIFGPDQIADLLNVAPRTVVQWIDSGLLTGYRLPGKKKPRRVTRANLVKFAKQNKLPLEFPGLNGQEVKNLTKATRRKT